MMFDLIVKPTNKPGEDSAFLREVGSGFHLMDCPVIFYAGCDVDSG
jgi:hypothetical protein